MNFGCPRAHILHLLSLADIFLAFLAFFIVFISLFLAFLFYFMSLCGLWSSQSSPIFFWPFLMCLFQLFWPVLMCLVRFFGLFLKKMSLCELWLSLLSLGDLPVLFFQDYELNYVCDLSLDTTAISNLAHTHIYFYFLNVSNHFKFCVFDSDKYRPQTPPNTHQGAHAAGRWHECENHIFESPQHCKTPDQPALHQIPQPQFNAHDPMPQIPQHGMPLGDPFVIQVSILLFLIFNI